ncbi:MAG: hypothetical protein EXX96DRAFT_536780 [Benjaminiella poitrasii]|nr:MAG: hypothetical protein EXX96DRAFT_536780 [Benjaminiella poitrasii]
MTIVHCCFQVLLIFLKRVHNYIYNSAWRYTFDKEQKYECSCESVYNDSAALRQHNLQKHTNEVHVTLKEATVYVSKIDDKIQCPVVSCLKTFTNFISFRNHCSQIHQGTVKVARRAYNKRLILDTQVDLHVFFFLRTNKRIKMQHHCFKSLPSPATCVYGSVTVGVFEEADAKGIKNKLIN